MLIALGLLGRPDLLKSLFEAVLVPEAVQREIEQGGMKLAGLADFRRAGWIRIVPLQTKRDALLEPLPMVVIEGAPFANPQKKPDQESLE